MNLRLNFFFFGLIFFLGYFVLSSSERNLLDLSFIIFSPLAFSFFLLSLYNLLNKITTRKYHSILRVSSAVLIFFLITISSYFGVTQSLTGSHNLSPNLYLYGLSFYSAYIALIIFKKNSQLENIFIAANPLLVITGPIVNLFRPIKHMGAIKRFNYFFPFFIIGIFFVKIVSIPLTHFLWMVELQDILSVLIFALIFELFIYFNFGGLSLLIYGLFGMLGFKIPLNFKQPFSANNIIEYWRGWHISLSYVLKHIFYKPIRKYGLYISLFCIYISSGLWHGASLNFILWGLFHATSFIVTINLLKYNFQKLSILTMFTSVIFGRMIFADSDISRLLNKFNFNIYEFDYYLFVNSPKYSLLSLIIALSIIMLEFFMKDKRLFKNRNYKFLRTYPSQVTILFITLFLITGGFGVEYAVYGQR
mgnify:FL=1